MRRILLRLCGEKSENKQKQPALRRVWAVFDFEHITNRFEHGYFRREYKLADFEHGIIPVQTAFFRNPSHNILCWFDLFELRCDPPLQAFFSALPHRRGIWG